MLIASGITTLGKTVLIVVAVTFIVWSLVTALVIPRNRPRFPRNMGAYILASSVLFVAQMGAVVWVTGTQEIEEAHAAEEEHGGGEERPGETTAGEEEVASGDAVAGKAVYEEAGCGTCHALADAGSDGAVGPNLDQAQPPQVLVIERVTNGQGSMPAFGDDLTEEQIAAVAAYVSSVAGAS